jgi:hypothetical protein
MNYEHVSTIYYELLVHKFVACTTAATFPVQLSHDMYHLWECNKSSIAPPTSVFPVNPVTASPLHHSFPHVSCHGLRPTLSCSGSFSLPRSSANHALVALNPARARRNSPSDRSFAVVGGSIRSDLQARGTYGKGITRQTAIRSSSAEGASRHGAAPGGRTAIRSSSGGREGARTGQHHIEPTTMGYDIRASWMVVWNKWDCRQHRNTINCM